MRSAPGLRVTSAPAFMRDAPPDVRALYRRHVRGNSLLRNLAMDASRTRRSRGTPNGPLGMVVGRARFRQRRLGRSLHRQRHIVGKTTSSAAGTSRDSSGARSSPVHRSRGCPGKPSTTRGGDRPAAGSRLDCQPATQRVPAQRWTRRLRRDLRNGRPRPRSRRPAFAALDVDGDADPDLAVMADWQARQLRMFRNDFAATPRRSRFASGHDEQPRRDRRPCDRRDR